MNRIVSAVFAAASALALNGFAATGGTQASFADFDRRANAGEDLSVVYFGASLTYSANASDPATTGFRGLMSDYLLARYPKARFRFHDAAIGGTPSMLGLFRMERDVLAKKPDLVFVDFVCNDGGDNVSVENTCFYEQIVRTLVGRGIAVEQLFFTFKWWAEGGGEYEKRVPRQKLYRDIAAHYSTPYSDTYSLVKAKVDAGETTWAKVWPIDGGHPADYGYTLFFEAAKVAFEKAVADGTACTVPEKPLYGEVVDVKRTRLADLALPKGWTREITFRNSLWFDGLSSRWMGDVARATAASEPFALKAKGNVFALFGEADDNSALKVRFAVDGQANDVNFQPNAGGRLFVFRPQFVMGWREGADGEHEIAISAVADEKRPNGEIRIESLMSGTVRPTAAGLNPNAVSNGKGKTLDEIDHARGKKD